MTASVSGSHVESIDLDQVFATLSDPICRRILTILATHYPRNEDEFHPPDLQSQDEELELFRTKLHHKHLPQLEDVGFIDWDHDSGSITRGPNFEEVEPLITMMSDHEDELPENWS